MEALNIRTVRKRFGLKQAEFGSLIGIHCSTVSAWERGYRKPRPESVRFLEALLYLEEHFPKAYEALKERYVQ